MENNLTVWRKISKKKVVVYRFLLVFLPLLVHVKGSPGVCCL